MHIPATHDQARAILKAMYSVAGPVTDADRTSINAAMHYIFRLNPDPSVMRVPSAAELQALAADPALANEAVRFATVMAFIDGKLDDTKLQTVLGLAGKLGIKEDYVDDVAKLAQGHLRDATAHMVRANLESVIGHPIATEDQRTNDCLVQRRRHARPDSGFVIPDSNRPLADPNRAASMTGNFAPPTAAAEFSWSSVARRQHRCRPRYFLRF